MNSTIEQSNNKNIPIAYGGLCLGASFGIAISIFVIVNSKNNHIDKKSMILLSATCIVSLVAGIYFDKKITEKSTKK